MATTDYETRFLVSISIFEGLSADDLALITQHLEPQVFNPGTVVVTEGAPARELYIIADGRAEVLKRTPDGRETKLTELGAGACFGEMALVGTMPRAATVRACSRLTTLRLPYAQVVNLSREHLPTFALLVINLARELSHRLYKADAVLAEFGLPAGFLAAPPSTGRGH